MNGPEISFIITKQLMPSAEKYHCFRCKTHMLDLVGDVLVIWQGVGYPVKELPININFAVHHICRGCKKQYNFYFQV